MNKDFLAADKFHHLKDDFQKWFRTKKRMDDSSTPVDQTHRNAEELIWKLQERFGYVGIRPERDR